MNSERCPISRPKNYPEHCLLSTTAHGLLVIIIVRSLDLTMARGQVDKKDLRVQYD